MSKKKPAQKLPPTALYGRIRDILESAQTSVARSVNSAQVIANWLIGQEIVEEQQRGKARAAYGDALVRTLSDRLQLEFGNGYSFANLKLMRQFYLTYPQLLDRTQKGYALRSLSWQPGLFHPNLSWTHYRRLVRVENELARSFYEIEAIESAWSARELERQINSLLYD